MGRKDVRHILVPSDDHPGTDRCLLTPTKIPLFRTGRVDCQPEVGLKDAWETSEHEVHPNVASNGVTTADFFKEHFDLTGREGAALLVGAHSFGKFNVKLLVQVLVDQAAGGVLEQPDVQAPGHETSVHGASREGANISDRRPSWATCRKPMASKGQQVHPLWRSLPVGSLVPEMSISNKCAKMAPEKALSARNSTTAYPDYPKAAYGPGKDRAEPDTPDGCCKGFKKGDGRCNPECQRYIVNDETALSADTGYYFAFNVSEATGLPSGCNAFDEAKKWSDDTTSKGYAGPIDCPLQTYAPEGEPLHSIVEEFADDQNAWLRDFLPALQKMVENKAGDLVESPSTWFSAECDYVDRRKNLACS